MFMILIFYFISLCWTHYCVIYDLCISCIALLHYISYFCKSFLLLVSSLFICFLTQANEKSGGYINKLVVTCLRSGLNKMFRVLQKPERAPIRALRTSSSGRWISKLYLCYDPLIHYYFSSWIFFLFSTFLSFLYWCVNTKHETPDGHVSFIQTICTIKVEFSGSMKARVYMEVNHT